MAIIKACKITNNPKNTGKQCDTAMLATAMQIAIQRAETFDDNDLADPITWLTGLIHAKKAFPLFGQIAPIREITNENEADVVVTLDDGLRVHLRYGMINRTFGTTSGGLCYAEALMSFLNSGYSILEIDQTGQLLARKNADGTYSGLVTDYMNGLSPIIADLKNTPYKNRFTYSYMPTELVRNGIIFSGAAALLEMQGLLDVIFKIAAAATTTKLKIAVITSCAEEDLVAKIGADLADPTNYRVEDVAALGTAVAISAAAIVGGHIELTGVFTTAHTYRVTGTSPAVWFSNNIEGYDASTEHLDILIP